MIFLNLVTILFTMVFILLGITSFWMSWSNVMSLELVQAMDATKKSGRLISIRDGLTIYAHQFYYMSTIVSQVGYGDGRSLPDDGIQGTDFINIYITMLIGLIIWQFP